MFFKQLCLECFQNRVSLSVDVLPLKTLCFGMDWAKRLLVAGISELFLINILFKDRILKEHSIVQISALLFSFLW